MAAITPIQGVFQIGAVSPFSQSQNQNRVGTSETRPPEPGEQTSQSDKQTSGLNESTPDPGEPASGQGKEDENSPETTSSPSNTQGLSQSELKLVQELKKADTEVRAHEMAHIAAGGQYITSGAKLQYQRGPDGVNYAVAGEVSIDTSPIPGDPRATIQKMKKIKAAALAPASPSGQDRKVAASASALAAKASAELTMLMTAQSKASTKETATASSRTAATAYAGMAEETIPNGTYLDIAA